MNLTDKLWYRVYRTKGIGGKSMHRIFQALESHNLELSAIFDMPFEELKEKTGLKAKACLELGKTDEGEDLETEWEQLQAEEINLVHLRNEHYPLQVYRKLGDEAPPILFCKGDLSLLNAPGIAIIGSRDASDESIEKTRSIAAKLAEKGKCVISGYARGVDDAAHLGALEAGGSTTFVLSLGIIHFDKKGYFKRLKGEQNFLAVSQFHPFEVWRGRNAMARNNLTVALAEAVIVVESGPQVDPLDEHISGTFHSGEIALQLGIPLYVLSPQEVPESAVGNEELIQKGGVEVSVEEILKRI